MKSDLVGYISILHLRIADLKGLDCEECLKLAEAASHAVDFPKTGAAVDFQSLPRLDQPQKPDFLCQEGANPDSEAYYRSPKVLGKLFRNVPMEKCSPFEGDTLIYHKNRHLKISEALQRIRFQDIGLPCLKDPSTDLLQEMRYILSHYKDQLMAIARAHTLARNPNQLLSEAELVSGTIQSTWADHRRRREAVTAMNLQASGHNSLRFYQRSHATL
jgi:RNA-dependent RNA polymerase